ncbi:MAG: Hpt domain-containing protein [Pirellulaceae bacterium]
MSLSEHPASIIDINEALSYTAGDVDVLLSVAELFVDEGPKQLSEIEVQIRAANAVGIAKSAHQLKGSVAIFGAHQTTTAAHDLEQIARSGQLDRIPVAWQTLVDAMDRLLLEIRDLPKRLPKSEEGSAL